MEEKKNLSENILDIKKLNLWYGENHALKDVDMEIKRNAITAFIGPSGCGKSTFLKTLNRMNDLVPGVRIEGQVLLDGIDIYGPKVDTSMLRKKIGMVFQQPNPFPMSIYDNVAYGPRIHGIKNKAKLDRIVEESLRGAAIFDEVKERVKRAAKKAEEPAAEAAPAEPAAPAEEKKPAAKKPAARKPRTAKKAAEAKPEAAAAEQAVKAEPAEKAEKPAKMTCKTAAKKPAAKAEKTAEPVKAEAAAQAAPAAEKPKRKCAPRKKKETV